MVTTTRDDFLAIDRLGRRDAHNSLRRVRRAEPSVSDDTSASIRTGGCMGSSSAARPLRRRVCCRAAAYERCDHIFEGPLWIDCVSSGLSASGVRSSAFTNFGFHTQLTFAGPSANFRNQSTAAIQSTQLGTSEGSTPILKACERAVTRPSPRDSDSRLGRPDLC